MGRRLVVLALPSVLAAAGVASAAPVHVQASWAAPQIRSVLAHGLMSGPTAADFRPDDPLTRQALADLVLGLSRAPVTAPPPPAAEPPTLAPGEPAATQAALVTTGGASPPAPAVPEPATPPLVADPEGTVTLAALDARLVAALGLSGAAAEFARGAAAAGLRVPARFGTEVVARLLGLRTNHPAAQDALELLPGDPATRAEAAFSAARILDLGRLGNGRQTAGVQSLADSFALPQLDDWQRRILTVALSKVGMPYVWGGTSDGSEAPFGVQASGGYDCSGFVWRVYKLQRYPDEGSLAATLRGRTTYDMSVEVPRPQRIPFAQLEPADVVFFGERGPRSRGAQVDHMGIYLGNGWFVHSSDQGVSLDRLTGWYRTTFAWGRRPLSEAGLSS